MSLCTSPQDDKLLLLSAALLASTADNTQHWIQRHKGCKAPLRDSKWVGKKKANNYLSLWNVLGVLEVFCKDKIRSVLCLLNKLFFSLWKWDIYQTTVKYSFPTQEPVSMLGILTQGFTEFPPCPTIICLKLSSFRQKTICMCSLHNEETDIQQRQFLAIWGTRRQTDVNILWILFVWQVIFISFSAVK